MREHVANTIYTSDDMSLPVSEKPYRYPINSLLSQTVNVDDELKIVLLIKKDGNAFYAGIAQFKSLLNAHGRNIASEDDLKHFEELELQAELSDHIKWLDSFADNYSKM